MMKILAKWSAAITSFSVALLSILCSIFADPIFQNSNTIGGIIKIISDSADPQEAVLDLDQLNKESDISRSERYNEVTYILILDCSKSLERNRGDGPVAWQGQVLKDLKRQEHCHVDLDQLRRFEATTSLLELGKLRTAYNILQLLRISNSYLKNGQQGIDRFNLTVWSVCGEAERIYPEDSTTVALKPEGDNEAIASAAIRTILDYKPRTPDDTDFEGLMTQLAGQYQNQLESTHPVITIISDFSDDPPGHEPFSQSARARDLRIAAQRLLLRNPMVNVLLVGNEPGSVLSFMKDSIEYGTIRSRNFYEVLLAEESLMLYPSRFTDGIKVRYTNPYWIDTVVRIPVRESGKIWVNLIDEESLFSRNHGRSRLRAQYQVGAEGESLEPRWLSLWNGLEKNIDKGQEIRLKFSGALPSRSLLLRVSDRNEATTYFVGVRFIRYLPQQVARLMLWLVVAMFIFALFFVCSGATLVYLTVKRRGGLEFFSGQTTGPES